MADGHMLTPRPAPGPVLRRAAPATSVQQSESPDAAEVQNMADQRPPATDPDREVPTPAEHRTARVRPPAPPGAGASGPALTDIQTTSGVPKVVIPPAVEPEPVEAAPAESTGGDASVSEPAAGGAAAASDVPAEVPVAGDVVEVGTDGHDSAASESDEQDPEGDKPEADLGVLEAGSPGFAEAPATAPERSWRRPAALAATDHQDLRVSQSSGGGDGVEAVGETDIEQVSGGKADIAPQPDLEVEGPAERKPQADVDLDPTPDDPTPDATVAMVIEPPGGDTVLLRPPAVDDTVLLPAATVAPPAEVPGPVRARVRRAPLDLGHAPAVLTISALGVLMVALAYAGGRISTGNALFAYWVGQVVVFTPVVVRLLSRRTAVAESFLLVMGLAVHQYLLKWMYSPDQFRFPDELQHWLATTIIVQSGELFRPNPALPPAEHFPGLAELGAATAELTGLPVTAAGIIVAGVAHLVFVGVLFAVVLRASNSPAVAGVACVTYATALHYLFFNSMFLYQTAALPFFMLTVWAVRRWRAEGGRAFAALAVAAMVLTTVSHHVTALALVATLLLLGVAELVVDRPRRWSALAMPGVAAVVVAGWILLVATDVLGYLEAPVDQVTRTVSQLASGESDAASATAPVAPGQLVIQGAGLLGLLVLCAAVTRAMVHRRDRDWWRWAAVAGALVFFAGNGVRFLGQNGPEIAGRLSTFTYLPVALLAAIGLVRGVQLIPATAPGGSNPYRRIGAGAAMVTLLMVGARTGGYPPIATILPGPYLAGAYERSVDAYGVAAADWQRTTLGPGNRVGGDATSVSLASTYGRQDPVREVGPLYYADAWGLAQDDLAQRLHVRYLVVDRRLGTHLPSSGAYFEADPRSGQITSPLTGGQLGKFDTLTGVDRLYDNGTVRIYRTGVQ